MLETIGRTSKILPEQDCVPIKKSLDHPTPWMDFTDKFNGYTAEINQATCANLNQTVSSHYGQYNTPQKEAYPAWLYK